MVVHAGRQAAFLLSIWITAAGLPAMALTGAAVVFWGPLRWIAAAVLAALVAAAALWYPPRWAAAFTARFDGRALYTQSGVLWRKERLIPVDALRTLECRATPLQRKLGLQSLVLRFAGGAATLALLDREEAQKLAALLEKAEPLRDHDF